MIFFISWADKQSVNGMEMEWKWNGNGMEIRISLTFDKKKRIKTNLMQEN
jgi:hypothetical protein